MLQGHIQLFYGAGADATIVIKAVAALKAFDRIHERSAVGLCISRQGVIRRQIAHESQEAGQTLPRPRMTVPGRWAS